MVGIAETMVAIKASYAAVKKAVETKQALDSEEARALLTQAMKGLNDAEQALIAVQRENRELEDKLAFKENTLEKPDGYRYQLDENGEETGLYYCPACASNGIIIPMNPPELSMRRAKCARCKHTRLVKEQQVQMPPKLNRF
ncbi:MAG: hypothetical protein V7727_20875 [Sneathiella sp.]